MNPLIPALPFLPPSFRELSARLWVPEHLEWIAGRVHGTHPDRPLPQFEAEVTPPVQPLADQLRTVWNASPVELAAKVEQIGLDGLLLLLDTAKCPSLLT